ncbi:MAG: hypothetical protein L6R39_006600, partial [Caloplaca ligustica]
MHVKTVLLTSFSAFSAITRAWLTFPLAPPAPPPPAGCPTLQVKPLGSFLLGPLFPNPWSGINVPLNVPNCNNPPPPPPAPVCPPGQSCQAPCPPAPVCPTGQACRPPPTPPTFPSQQASADAQCNAGGSMQNTGQKRRPIIRTFEDGRTSPPPKQVYFPPRRHSTGRKRTTSSTPSTTWKQQTLTQITPSLTRASSSYESFDGANDLEYDSLTSAMPPKKKRRKAQQTITQMDPFKEQLHAEEDHHELVPQPSPVVGIPPLRTKRRRSTHTPNASAVQTRSTRKRAAEANVKEEVAKASNFVDPGTEVSLLESRNMRMPLPTTPKRFRRRVVPSSQSPAETPFSNHSSRRRDRECQGITALQERSVNTPSRSRLSNRRKTVQWAPKLEVADSTNFESRSSEDLFPPIVQTVNPVKTQTKKPPLPTWRSPSKPPVPPTPASRTPHVNDEIPKPVPTSSQGSRPRTLERKDTIADSEDDEYGSLDRSPDKRTDSETQQVKPTPPSTVEKDNTSSPNAQQGRLEKEPEQTAHSPQQDIPQNSYNSFETVPTQLLDHPLQPPSPPLLEHTPKPLRFLSQTHDTDSANASAQLQSELLSSPPAAPPQPPALALETESQFENAWREFTPPQLGFEDEVEPDLPPLPTLPDPGRNNSANKYP